MYSDASILQPVLQPVLLELSVVVLAFNEEKRIGRCVESLGFAQKLIVIDSYSTDNTESAVRQAWARSHRLDCDLIYVKTQWKGFTQTRNDSLKWVSTAWVFWVDADEWVSEELKNELFEKLSLANSVEIFANNFSLAKIPRQSFFLGKAIRHGGWYPDRKSRLGKSAELEWRGGPNQADVHEDLFAKNSSAAVLFEGHLYHEPFLDRNEQWQTNDRYSTLLAQALAEKIKKGERKMLASQFLIFRILWKFFENYIFKLGILDGIPGFFIAKGSAESLAMRYQKARAIVQQSLGPRR